METQIKIRAAKPSDVPQIKKVHTTSIRKLCRKDYSPFQIKSWSGGRTNALYLSAMEKGERFWVGIRGKRILGFSANLGPEIRAVYIHPYYAGQGIGRKLLAMAERSAKKQGYYKLRLCSSLTALDFYKSHGWKIIRWGKHRLRTGAKIRCIHMRKQV